jgi:hypothetical protein
MKITLLSAGSLLAISLMLNGVARADDSIQLVSNYDNAETQAVPRSIAASYATEMTSEAEPTPACGGCGACDQCQSCNECDDCSGGLRSRIRGLFQRSCDPPSITCSPRVAGYVYSGIDSFSGVTTGTYPGNTGVVTGFNLGGALLEDRGIGWQLGGSYGLYNFEGRTSPGSQIGSDTHQMFITAGVFRRADADRRFSWGVVHDWMITNNFGDFGNSPTLAQFRGQAAWALSAWNQVGVWSTIEDRYVTRSTGALGTPVAYQAIDQGNLFWDHQFGAYGATSRFSIGVPLNNRLQQTASGFPAGGFGNTLGSFIVSTNWNAPITTRMSLYANALYMKPSAYEGSTTAGAFAQAQEFWNVSFGFAFSPGGNLRSKTIAGRSWMPYLPTANNSNFLIDASKTE